MRQLRLACTVLVLVTPVCLVTACRLDQQESSTSKSSGAISLLDASGVQHILPRPAGRLLSLVPSATETLRAMGAASTLIGRTDYDTGTWIAELPSVGGGLGPNLEAIVSLQPDLVVRFAGGQDQATPSRLDELGIPHISVRPDQIEDIYTTAKLLGRATGYEAAADSLVQAIRSNLERVASLTAKLPRQRVAYVLGGSPPWVSGPGTYIHEVITLVGGENVFGDLGPLYSAVSFEEILNREIDVVLIPNEAAADPFLSQDARIEVFGPELEMPGPDVVEAASRVAELLHGIELP